MRFALAVSSATRGAEIAFCTMLVSLPCEGRAVQEAEPHEMGQWAGPYDLDGGLTEGGSFVTGEITHAAVLPPSGPGVAETRVLFVCDPTSGVDCTDTPNPGATAPFGHFGRSYLWSPRTPSNVTKVAVHPAYPQDGSQDLFCGGHAFLADGDLLWMGGTDYDWTCVGAGFIGHREAWRLDTSQQVPVWSPASSTSEQMGIRRWYPTGTLLEDGNVLVTGNVGNAADPNGATRSEYRPGAGVGDWLNDEGNLEWDGVVETCANGGAGRMWDTRACTCSPRGRRSRRTATLLPASVRHGSSS